MRQPVLLPPRVGDSTGPRAWLNSLLYPEGTRESYVLVDFDGLYQETSPHQAAAVFRRLIVAAALPDEAEVLECRPLSFGEEHTEILERGTIFVGLLTAAQGCPYRLLDTAVELAGRVPAALPYSYRVRRGF